MQVLEKSFKIWLVNPTIVGYNAIVRIFLLRHRQPRAFWKQKKKFLLLWKRSRVNNFDFIRWQEWLIIGLHRLRRVVIWNGHKNSLLWELCIVCRKFHENWYFSSWRFTKCRFISGIGSRCGSEPRWDLKNKRKNKKIRIRSPSRPWQPFLNVPRWLEMFVVRSNPAMV
jgi:hypothetical protein